jgi:hypothetical protein
MLGRQQLTCPCCADLPDAKKFPVPNVNSPILKYVLKYMDKHWEVESKLNETGGKEEQNKLKNELEEWDSKYLAVNRDMLIMLVKVRCLWSVLDSLL